MRLPKPLNTKLFVPNCWFSHSSQKILDFIFIASNHRLCRKIWVHTWNDRILQQIKNEHLSLFWDLAYTQIESTTSQGCYTQRCSYFTNPAGANDFNNFVHAAQSHLEGEKNPLVVTPRRMHKLSYLSWYSPTPSQENTSSFFMIRTHSLHPLSAGFQNSTFALHAAVWLQNNAFCDRFACWVIVIKWLPTKPKIYINFRQIERSSWALLIWRKSNFNQIC